MKNNLRFSPVVALILGTSLTFPQTAQAVNILMDFDNFTSVPLDGSTGFEFANGGNTYQGVTFGSPNQFNVTGKNYRVDTTTPGPLFAIPKSNDYYINNREEPSSFLTTNLILTKAWFSSVEYYGFGGGATSVTVTALGASGDLGSVSLDLTHDPNNLGKPDPMKPMDTSSFLSLSGITGYRIDRVPNGQFGVNWAGDNFTFTDAVPAAVPWETDTSSLVASTVLFGVGLWLKHKFSKTREK